MFNVTGTGETPAHPPEPPPHATEADSPSDIKKEPSEPSPRAAEANLDGSDDAKHSDGNETSDSDDYEYDYIVPCNTLPRNPDALRVLQECFAKYPNFLSTNAKNVDRCSLFKTLQEHPVLQPLVKYIRELDLLLLDALEVGKAGPNAYARFSATKRPKHARESMVKFWCLLLVATAFGWVAEGDGWVVVRWDLLQLNPFWKECMCEEEYARNVQVAHQPYVRTLLDNYLSNRFLARKEKKERAATSTPKKPTMVVRCAQRCKFVSPRTDKSTRQVVWNLRR